MGAVAARRPTIGVSSDGAALYVGVSASGGARLGARLGAIVTRVFGGTTLRARWHICYFDI